MSAPSNTRLERTRHQRASWLSNLGEPLKRRRWIASLNLKSMMRYLLAILPASIILVVSLATPILILKRCRETMRKQPDHFEVLRFRAVISLLVWFIPTSVVWLLAAITAWVSTWPEQRPEPGRIRLAAQTSTQSNLKGYLIWLGCVGIYLVTCYILVRWNSRRYRG